MLQYKGMYHFPLTISGAVGHECQHSQSGWQGMQPFYIQRQAKNKGNRCASVAGAQEFSRGSTGVIRYGTGLPKRGKRLPRGSSQNIGQGVMRGEGQCPVKWGNDWCR